MTAAKTERKGREKCKNGRGTGNPQARQAMDSVRGAKKEILGKKEKRGRAKASVKLTTRGCSNSGRMKLRKTNLMVTSNLSVNDLTVCSLVL